MVEDDASAIPTLEVTVEVVSFISGMALIPSDTNEGITKRIPTTCGSVYQR